MYLYYVNQNGQENGDHEVHKSSCAFQPELQHRKYLGYFDTCYEALVEARKIYPNTDDGCHYCCPQCDLR